MTEKETIEFLIMEAIEEDVKIDAKEELSYPPVALSLGETLIKSPKGDMLLPIPLGTYGNFSVISGPPKTKKTFFVSLIASVYLSGQNNFGADIKGHRDNKTLLHIDTEQGRWHCQRVFKRVHSMCNMEVSNIYHTFGLRTINYSDRIKFIEYCIKHKYQNLGIILIDGVADLVSDVNNIEETNAVVQKIMELSALYNIHIICVIHSNFGSEKMTGWLGSSIEKKCELQIQLEANTVNKDWITVKCKRSRGYPFETFSFQVNDLGLPEVVGNFYDPLKP